MQFPLYLWGIEIDEFYAKVKHIVMFPLYLWGIEILPVSGKFKSTSGFHFTYEELKF